MDERGHRCAFAVPVRGPLRSMAISPALRAAPMRAPTFSRDTAFQLELRRRVAEYFWATGRRERDCWQMYVKTAVLITGSAGAYVLLVFAARSWSQAAPLAVLLGLFAAGIGFNIQHDGGHRAYSNRPWVNKLMALTLELIGGSSYLWHWKHGVFHHTYVNIAGHDTDIDLGALGRLTPHQDRRRIPPLATPVPLAALRVDGDQVAAASTTSATIATGRVESQPRPAAEGVGPGDLPRRQGGLLRAGLRDPAAVPPALDGALLLCGRRAGRWVSC